MEAPSKNADGLNSLSCTRAGPKNPSGQHLTAKTPEGSAGTSAAPPCGLR